MRRLTDNLPELNDVSLSITDYLSEEDYDMKKAGIIGRGIDAKIKVEYRRGENYIYPTSDGYTIVKSRPKLKGIDGNTAINHELGHALFNSFDKRAAKTIEEWSDEWINDTDGDTAIKQFAHNTYHEAMNVLEDQRIESLWGKFYLGNVRDFIKVRKNIGKDIVEGVQHPTQVLLAERCFRKDIANNNKYSFVSCLLYKVEFVDVEGTCIVLRMIKPFLDEKISEYKKSREEFKETYKKMNETKQNLMDNPSDTVRVEAKNASDSYYKKYNDISKLEKPINNIDKRINNPTMKNEDLSNVESYKLDDVIGDKAESRLATLREQMNDKITVLREKMSDVGDGISESFSDSRIIKRVIQKKGVVDNAKINMKVSKSISNLLKSFKERTVDKVSEEGHDLDIGEYIDMQASGNHNGDCFTEEKEDNGLSVVISIDASGSMERNNPLIINMISTLWEGVKNEKNIDIRCITWSSDHEGNMYYRKFSPDDIKYLGQQTGGYTPTHFGIDIGSKELRKMSGRRKLLIVITDGFPNYQVRGVRLKNDLISKKTLKSYKIATKYTPNIVIVGVGYGFHNAMEHMFGKKYIGCQSMYDVEKFITNNLRKEIIRVMKKR